MPKRARGQDDVTEGEVRRVDHRDGAYAEVHVTVGAHGPVWDIVHTHVPEALRGKGRGADLCRHVFGAAAAAAATVVPTCTYVHGPFVQKSATAAERARCLLDKGDGAAPRVALGEHDGALVPVVYGVDVAALRTRGAEVLAPGADGGSVVFTKAYAEHEQRAADGGAGLHAGFSLRTFLTRCAPELRPHVDGATVAARGAFLDAETARVWGC